MTKLINKALGGAQKTEEGIWKSRRKCGQIGLQYYYYFTTLFMTTHFELMGETVNV